MCGIDIVRVRAGRGERFLVRGDVIPREDTDNVNLAVRIVFRESVPHIKHGEIAFSKLFLWCFVVCF